MTGPGTAVADATIAGTLQIPAIPPTEKRLSRQDIAIGYADAVRRHLNARNAERGAEEKLKRLRGITMQAEIDMLRWRRVLDADASTEGAQR